MNNRVSVPARQTALSMHQSMQLPTLAFFGDQTAMW